MISVYWTIRATISCFSWIYMKIKMYL